MSARFLASARGVVEGGRFLPNDRDRFVKLFVPHEGKEVTVTVKRWHQLRTDRENKYYWAVVVGIIADNFGEDDPDTVHDFLKAKFNPILRSCPRKEREAVQVEMGRSTTVLTTVEFEDYVERIRRWASMELDLWIPNPNEVEVLDD